MNTVRIPADVDRADRLLAGLTGRQLLVIAAGVAYVAVVYDAVGAILPGPALAAVIVPPTLLCLAMAFGRVDALPGDRFVGFALRHLRRPRVLVPAPDGVVGNPFARRHQPRIGALHLPATAVDADGVVDLGVAGCALLCRASSLNFGMRTPEEQQALVATVAAWLNSLADPVQILIRAERVDVAHLVEELDRGAPALEHHELERAAREHAQFLAELAARHDLLRREVLLVFRHPARRSAAVSAALRRRADDAISALAAAGIVVTPLDEAAALAALSRAADPDTPLPNRILTWPTSPPVGLAS